MKKIIIINGTGGCGKDTFIEFVSEYANVLNVSSIDKVKEVARIIGWSGTKTDKDRKFLHDLKCLTTAYNDFAFNDIKEKVEIFRKDDHELMFIHIREPEEIKRAVTSFDANTLLIKRPDIKEIKTNYADASVLNYDYDFIIENNSLETLEEEAKNFVRVLRRK